MLACLVIVCWVFVKIKLVSSMGFRISMETSLRDVHEGLPRGKKSILNMSSTVPCAGAWIEQAGEGELSPSSPLSLLPQCDMLPHTPAALTPHQETVPGALCQNKPFLLKLPLSGFYESHRKVTTMGQMQLGSPSLTLDSLPVLQMSAWLSVM